MNEPAGDCMISAGCPIGVEATGSLERDLADTCQYIQLAHHLYFESGLCAMPDSIELNMLLDFKGNG